MIISPDADACIVRPMQYKPTIITGYSELEYLSGGQCPGREEARPYKSDQRPPRTRAAPCS